MRSLNDLKEIANRDNWEKFLDGDDFREMVEEIARLRTRETTRLREAVNEWKGRIGRLDMLAGEIAETPGAEHLITPAKAAVAVIDQLLAAMDQTLRS